MKNTCVDLTGKLPDQLIQLYQLVNQQAAALSIPYLLVGATARDLILVEAYGAPLQRATRDIDFAIKVAHWDDFARVTAHLERVGFKSTAHMPHRFILEISGQPWEVDILPFGDISTNATISWPPKHTIEMNVMGFTEAYEHSLMVRLSENPQLQLQVASPVGMLLLKLIAWLDRAIEVRSKDATDICYLIEHYSQVPGIADDLYDEGQMEAQQWDMEMAAAMKLGQELQRMMASPTLTYLEQQLFSRADRLQILSNEMSRATHNNPETCISRLMALQQGLYWLT